MFSGSVFSSWSLFFFSATERATNFVCWVDFRRTFTTCLVCIGNIRWRNLCAWLTFQSEGSRASWTSYQFNTTNCPPSHSSNHFRISNSPHVQLYWTMGGNFSETTHIGTGRFQTCNLTNNHCPEVTVHTAVASTSLLQIKTCCLCTE